MDGSNVNNTLNEPFEKFWRANVINKSDNGILKSYIQRKGDSNNTGYLLDLDTIKKEDLFFKFKSMATDESFMSKISNMKEEEIANLLLDAISEDKNLKKYYMESNDKQSSFDEKGSISSSIVEDGVVNKELGIVENPSSNKIKTVEENNDNYVVKEDNFDEIKNSSSNGMGRSSEVIENVSSEINYVEESGAKKDDFKNKNDQSFENVEGYEKKRKLVRAPSYMSHSSGLISYNVIIVIILLLFIGFILFSFLV